MKDLIGFCVKLHTSEFRGDHTADVCRIVDVRRETTIGELLGLCFPIRDEDEYVHHEHSFVEVRPIYARDKAWPSRNTGQKVS